jgi:hypothetical protein
MFRFILLYPIQYNFAKCLELEWNVRICFFYPVEVVEVSIIGLQCSKLLFLSVITSLSVQNRTAMSEILFLSVITSLSVQNWTAMFEIIASIRYNFQYSTAKFGIVASIRYYFAKCPELEWNFCNFCSYLKYVRNLTKIGLKCTKILVISGGLTFYRILPT